MPRLADLRRNYSTSAELTDRDVVLDESMVSDLRSHLTSTDLVERKVGAALSVCHWILGGLRGAGRTVYPAKRELTSRRILPR